jgi:hypothetical protein
MKLVGLRRRISVVIGCTQSAIGAFASISAYLLYYNSLGVQAMLNVPSSDVASYMVVLVIFGVLSVISGLYLITCDD